MVATKSSYQRAIDKAEALGGARLIVSRAGATYTVRGSVAPATYAVTLGADGELHCECAAGAHDLPCYHAAACWLLRKGLEAAGVAASPSRYDGATAPVAERSGLG